MDPATPHYDLIGAIQNIRQATQIRFSFEHVCGHQDSGITTVLTRTAWMNIKMDTLAKATIGQEIGPQKYQIAGEPWICYIKGHRQVKEVSTALRTHINTITIKEHWEKSNNTRQATRR